MKSPRFQAITDPDTQIIVSLSLGLQHEYLDPENDPWAGTPFAWIRTRPSRQVGKIGEQLVSGWCAARDLNVLRSPDSQADRIIEGKRVEIKFSTLWASGMYKFQQIRDQNYDYLICLGLSPFVAHAWILSKQQLLSNVIGNHSFSQHRGHQGSDTFWLNVDPTNPPRILSAQTGRLSSVKNVLGEGTR